MKHYSQIDIDLLKSNLGKIVVDAAEGGGFTIILHSKDGQQEPFPGSMSLAEALECSLWLGNLACLQEDKILVNGKGIHANRSSDIHARRASKEFTRQGYGPKSL